MQVLLRRTRPSRNARKSTSLVEEFLGPGVSAAEYSARNTRKITSAAENICSMSLMTKLILTINDPHDVNVIM